MPDKLSIPELVAQYEFKFPKGGKRRLRDINIPGIVQKCTGRPRLYPEKSIPPGYGALGRAKDPLELIERWYDWEYVRPPCLGDMPEFANGDKDTQARMRRDWKYRDPYGLAKAAYRAFKGDPEDDCRDFIEENTYGMIGELQRRFFDLTGRQCRNYAVADANGESPDHLNWSECNHLLCPACWHENMMTVLDLARRRVGDDARYWYLRVLDDLTPGAAPGELITKYRHNSLLELAGYHLSMNETWATLGTTHHVPDADKPAIVGSLVGIWYSKDLVAARKFRGGTNTSPWYFDRAIKDPKTREILGVITTRVYRCFEDVAQAFIEHSTHPGLLLGREIDALDAVEALKAQFPMRRAVSRGKGHQIPNRGGRGLTNKE